MILGFGDPGMRCSSAGCTADAVVRVNWRNPHIHSQDRVKVWLACADHRETLSGYLTSRGFPVLVTARDEHIDHVPDQG